MRADHDDFHFAWTRMAGNFLLSARARFVGPGVEPHRKIGWSIRPALEPNGAHVTAVLHGNGLASHQVRRTAGGTTEEAKTRDSLPEAADAVICLGGVLAGCRSCEDALAGGRVDRRHEIFTRR
jgi:hypothetical protein